MTAAQSLHLTDLPPREPSSLGLGGRYDGNMLGGALLGAGMAISGACPGTVLAQLGVGVSSGRYALGGAVAGGMVWSWIRKRRTPRGPPNSAPVPSSCSSSAAAAAIESKREVAIGGGKGGNRQTGAVRKDGRGDTVYGLLGISRGALLVGLEVALVLAISAAVRYTPADAAEARGLPPYYAGLAIAAAQLVSILLRRSLLGASTAFEELGGWLWGVHKYSNLLFSVGVVGGAWLVSHAVPALRPVTEVAISPLRSALGGFLIVFGSRMAGGCTSGHGISGLSLMSTSSFLTAAAIFGVGGLTGLLLG